MQGNSINSVIIMRNVTKVNCEGLTIRQCCERGIGYAGGIFDNVHYRHNSSLIQNISKWYGRKSVGMSVCSNCVTNVTCPSRRTNGRLQVIWKDPRGT